MVTCSHEIKRCLLLGKKSYDKPREHIKKQRHYFTDKCLYSQSYGFSSSCIWMWELDHKESWVPKNWYSWIEGYWRRLSRVPWTARTSNQSILKEINPEYSLEGLMLKLKLQYFGPWCEELTDWKRPWCWERLKAGGEEFDRGLDGWMASSTRWTWFWARSWSWWLVGNLACCSPWGRKELNMTERLNWTDRLAI